MYAAHAVAGGASRRTLWPDPTLREGLGMTPTERAKRLRHTLQGSFRIDLFSVVAERDFERLLAAAIHAAEREAIRRAADGGCS